MYCNGILCYTIDSTVRILDLHYSCAHEIVISIPELLELALNILPNPDEQLFRSEETFQMLYYSDSIISCLYKSSDSIALLLALSFERGILLAVELQGTEEIFVRHNDQFLYYGILQYNQEGVPRWNVYGYQLKSGKKLGEGFFLPDIEAQTLVQMFALKYSTDISMLSRV